VSDKTIRDLNDYCVKQIHYSNTTDILLRDAEHADFDANAKVEQFLLGAGLNAKRRISLMDFRRRVGEMRNRVDEALSPDESELGSWLIDLALRNAEYDDVLSKEDD
jgi:predicted nuclease with TOPRIM domain